VRNNELSETIIVGDTFIIVPDGRKSALDLAFQTFPELDAKFDDLDADLREEVFSVYDLLSNEMVRRWNDEPFRRRAGEFMNRLAESGDSLPEELLVICLLETLAVNAEVAGRAKTCLGAKAAGFLSVVEREMFGR
jgi:hypothetical protein